MMRPAFPTFAIAAGLVLALFQPAFASPASGAGAGDSVFNVGLGFMRGDTTYHISYYDATGGVESELEFPLRTMLLGLEYGYIGRNDRGQDRLRIGVQWLTNLDNGSGKLKDYDWLTDSWDIDEVGVAHPGLDIYSESDISLQANILDLRASYNFWQSTRLALGPLGGLLYQNFQYNARNVHQVGFGPYAPGATRSISGLVLTYDVTYVIPFLGMHAEAFIGSGFQAMLDLGYSPWASAEDEDDHVLRGKRAKAETSGSAFFSALTAQWNIEDNNFLLLRGQYLKIDTTGTQVQTWYRDEVTPSGTILAGTVSPGIGDKITSQQTSVSFIFSHRF